jgi:drug/metabolite transporter (DMT)-like permease
MTIPSLCWGLSFPALKIALQAYIPLAVVSIRLFFVAVILGVVFFGRYGLKGLPRKKDLPLFILIGILNPFLAFFLESTGLLYISASLASVVSSTIPLFTPLAAFLLLRDKISPFNILGLFIAFGGVCCIIFGRGAGTEFRFIGLVLMLASVLSCVFYIIAAKKLLHSYSPLTVLTFQQIFGFVLYIPLFFIREASFVFNPDNFNQRSFFSILFLAVFPSCIAYYLFNNGIKKIGPSSASAFINLTPVIAAIASYFILQEPLGFIKILGIFLAVTGLFLSQVKRNYRAT